MIYRLKAPTRKDIEDQIQVVFGIYYSNEEGKLVERFASKNYSYHYIGKEWITEPEYDEEGNVITKGELSDYVLADLNVYDDTEVIFESPVEVLTNINTPIHGWE